MDAVSIADLLHEAAETHHRVYRITDGTDPDWASWYADWLIGHSELPTLLGAEPVRSELVYVLVSLDKEYTQRQMRSRGRTTTPTASPNTSQPETRTTLLRAVGPLRPRMHAAPAHYRAATPAPRHWTLWTVGSGVH